jgi:hypothetical protein
MVPERSPKARPRPSPQPPKPTVGVIHDLTLAAARAGQQVCLVVEMAGDPAGHLVGNLLDAAGAGVEGWIDPGSQGRGEALMLGDPLLVPASPGRPGSQPLGEHLVRAVQVAEVDLADQAPRWERFELLGLQRAAEHGGAPVEGDAMGHQEPGVAPAVPTQLGDLKDEVGLEHLGLRQAAAESVHDGALAGPAGAGDHEQRERRERPGVPAAWAAQQVGGAVGLKLGERVTAHAKHPAIIQSNDAVPGQVRRP